MLSLATSVLGGGSNSAGGAVLVEGCLPLVMRLAEQLGVNEQTAATCKSERVEDRS